MPLSPQTTKVLVAGGTVAALVGVLFTFRDRISSAAGAAGAAAVSIASKGGKVISAAAFKTILATATPDGRAAKYSEMLLQAAREQGVSPFVLAAILEAESGSGEASAMRPQGPGGTGDWTPRKGKMPLDGLGWGRGLMQIDYAAHNFARTGNWKDPLSNIRYGAKVLKENLGFFSSPARSAEDPRPLEGRALLEAAVAAYNTGAGRVLESLRLGKHPDTTTAHGNYGANVLLRVARYTENIG